VTLENGGLLTLTAAAHSPGARGEETISIDCTNGRIDLPDPYGEGRLRVFNRDASGSERWNESAAASRRSHVAYLRAFTDSIRQRTQPLATESDATAALATVEAIYEAATSGSATDIVRYPR
jgi:predicted dehydrogenase